MKFLKAYAPFLNAKDIKGKTALHYACQNGNYNMVKLLLKYGALTHIRDSFGYKPIDLVKDSEPLKTVLKLHTEKTIQLYNEAPEKYREFQESLLQNRFSRGSDLFTNYCGEVSKLSDDQVCGHHALRYF